MIRVSTIKQIVSDSKGHALLESAICIPLLVFISAVIIQLVLLFNTKQVVNYAAFCGARAAVSYGNNPEKVIYAARMACIPISGPITAEAQDLLEFLNMDGLVDLDLDWLRDIPGLGTVVDIGERFVTSCIRTRLSRLAVTDSKATVEIIYYTKLILPIGALSRIVTGYRIRNPELIGIEIPLIPDELTGIINYAERLYDAVKSMAVPISSRCTLEF